VADASNSAGAGKSARTSTVLDSGTLPLPSRAPALKPARSSDRLCGPHSPLTLAPPITRSRGPAHRRCPAASRRRVTVLVPMRISYVGIRRVAIAAVAATTLVAGYGGGSTGHADLSRQGLVRLLGVVRRPQTSADRNPAVLVAIRRLPSSRFSAQFGSRPDAPLIRLVGVAPWGGKLYLVPFAAPTSEPQCEGTGRACAYLPPQETIAVSGAGFTGAFTLASISAGSALVGSPGTGHWALVVPDGVSRVAFMWPRQDLLTNVVYATKLRLTARVHANVAAVRTHRDEAVRAMILYSATGKVLKRVGQFANLDTVAGSAKSARAGGTSTTG
jgi:hypothetical protein